MKRLPLIFIGFGPGLEAAAMVSVEKFQCGQEECFLLPNYHKIPLSEAVVQMVWGSADQRLKINC